MNVEGMMELEVHHLVTIVVIIKPRNFLAELIKPLGENLMRNGYLYSLKILP